MVEKQQQIQQMLLSQNDMLLKALSNNGGISAGFNGIGNDNTAPCFFYTSPEPLNNDDVKRQMNDKTSTPPTNSATLEHENDSRTDALHQSLLLGPPQTIPEPVNKQRFSIANAHNPARKRATKGTSSAELVEASIRPIKEIKCNAATKSFFENVTSNK